MADIQYLISGVWFAENKISNVMLHPCIQNKTIGTGSKKSKAAIVDLLKKNNNIFTLEWNYKTKGWDLGSQVKLESNGNIRTVPDDRLSDNLDNLINMDIFPL